jgi:hypothetical protein
LALIEVALDCFAHVGSKFIQCVRLGDDIGPYSTGHESPLRRLLNDK